MRDILAILIKVLLRYIPQALLVLAPMATLGWSFIDYYGYQPDPITGLYRVALFEGIKSEVEFKVRFAVSALAVAGTIAFEAVNLYLPTLSARDFRNEYLTEKKQQWREKLDPSIRINIMYARRRWYVLWLFRVFEWAWNDGFVPPTNHLDANMWIADWQGVCGKALRTTLPHAAYLPPNTSRELTFCEKWLFQNEYRLSAWQLRRTRHVRAVLSVPILKQSKSLSTEYVAVGVVNLDSLTEEGAQVLLSRREDLSDYFSKFGKILAQLRF